MRSADDVAIPASQLISFPGLPITVSTFRSTHPGQPSTTVGSKCQVPRRLEGLEVFIWLEKGPACTQGIDKSQDDKTYYYMS